MTNQELITKYRMAVALKPGTQEKGIKICRQPNDEEMEYIKANKQDIIAEIEAEEQAKKETKENTVEIYLSSRGWGDYSPVEISADLRKSNTQLLAECREALDSANDVDNRNQTDGQLLNLIAEARAKHYAPKTEQKPGEHGPGYCYNCESYCYGDCGDFRPELTNEIIARKAKAAMREANYGIND